jgi:hypothetical protein
MSRHLEAAPSGSNSLGRVVVALVGRMADVEPTNRVRMSRNVLHDSPCIAPMGVHTFPRSYIPRTFTFLSGLVLEREQADPRGSYHSLRSVLFAGCDTDSLLHRV